METNASFRVWVRALRNEQKEWVCAALITVMNEMEGYLPTLWGRDHATIAAPTIFFELVLVGCRIIRETEDERLSRATKLLFCDSVFQALQLAPNYYHFVVDEIVVKVRTLQKEILR